MPVYKDTAANRKLDRVGKHFGKRDTDHPDERKYKNARAKYNEVLQRFINDINKKIKFIETADKEYLPRRGLATQTRDFGIIEKKRKAQQQKYSDRMIKLLKEAPLPTIAKDSDLTGFYFRGDNYKHGNTEEMKKYRKEKIEMYEESFNEKVDGYVGYSRNDLLKAFTDAVKERVSELYNIKSTAEPKALKLYTLN